MIKTYEKGFAYVPDTKQNRRLIEKHFPVEVPIVEDKIKEDYATICDTARIYKWNTYPPFHLKLSYQEGQEPDVKAFCEEIGFRDVQYREIWENTPEEQYMKDIVWEALVKAEWILLIALSLLVAYYLFSG